MQYDHDVTTLTPRHIVEAFQRAYSQVYGREAQVVHMFAEWYTVNGETVHRMTLFSEIARLTDLAKHQQAQWEQQQAALAQQQQAEFIRQRQIQRAQHAALIQQQMQYAQQQAALIEQQTVEPVQQQRPAKLGTDRSMIQRLISRLRGG